MSPKVSAVAKGHIPTTYDIFLPGWDVTFYYGDTAGLGPTTNTISLSLTHSHPEIALKEQTGLNVRMIEGDSMGVCTLSFDTRLSTLQGQIEESDPEIIPSMPIQRPHLSPSDSAEGGSNLSMMSE